MKYRINENLHCEVDTCKSHCNQEFAHCQITRNGNSVAQVWLDPVKLKDDHNLEHDEIEMVIDFVGMYRDHIMLEYGYIMVHGTDC